MENKKIIISVANETQKIQAQCPYGRKNNLACYQKLHLSELWAVLEENMIRPILVPILKCCWHKENNISKIYGWKDESEKFIKGDGDVIINYYQFWTLVPWGTKLRNGSSWMKQRYHFSDSTLEAFIDNFVVES